MDKKPRKQRFIVQEGETIADCLKRMDTEGYTPKRRIEKPIFKEEDSGIVPAGREIIFEGVLKES